MQEIGWLFFFAFILIALRAGAQADYPFRNPKLSDDARIADLLKRLTSAGKGRPHGWPSKDSASASRVFRPGRRPARPGAGRPGRVGSARPPALPTTTFPQEKGLGETWDPALLKKIGALEGEEARYYYQNPDLIVAESWCARPMPI